MQNEEPVPAALVQQFKPLPTIYNLRELIERCFEEARQAGFIRVTEGSPVSRLPENLAVVDTTEALKQPDGGALTSISAQVIAEERKLAEHIALTIVGELQELELIRKIAPMFRMFRQLEQNFLELDSATEHEAKMRSLRVPPPEEPEEK
jgi:hypothetical protein